MEHSIGYYITQMLSYTQKSDKYFIRNRCDFSFISNADSPSKYMPFGLEFYRNYTSILKNTFQSDCVLIGFYRDSMLVFKLENSVTLYFYYNKKSFEIVTANRPVRPIVIDDIEFYEEVYEAFYNKI